MSAVTWEPGDPLMPDNDCGAMVTPSISPAEQAEARREDDTPPPWWRPDTSTPGIGWTQVCEPCGVLWRGDDPCWMCGGDNIP